MEDEQIVKLYLQRNEKALEEAQRKYGAYCFHIARNILTIWEDAGTSNNFDKSTAD